MKEFQNRSLTIEVDDPRLYSDYLYIGNHQWSENKLWFNTNLAKLIAVDSLGKIQEIIDIGKVEKNSLGKPVEYKDGIVTDFFLFESEAFALYVANDKLKRFSPNKKGYKTLDLPTEEEVFFLNFRAMISTDKPSQKTLFVLSGNSGDFESFDLNIATNKIKPLFRGKFVPQVRSFKASKTLGGKIILFDSEWKGLFIFDQEGNKIHEFNMPQGSADIHADGKENFEKWFQMGFEELGARIIMVGGETEDLWILMNLNPNGKDNGPHDPYFLLRKNKSHSDFFQLKAIGQININEEGLVLITNLKDKKVAFEVMDFNLFYSKLNYLEN